MQYTYPLTGSGMTPVYCLLFLILTLGGCTSDETSPDVVSSVPGLSEASTDLELSLETFDALNTENDGTYCTVTWESGLFSHDEWSATEYVSNSPGTFHECYRDWSDETSGWTSWICIIDEAPMASLGDWTSMPALYEYCQEVIENSAETGYPLTLEFDEQGVLSTCYNRQTECEDGCEWGIPLYRFYFGTCEQTEWETPLL